MQRRALITGSFLRIADVGRALKDGGLIVTEVDDVGHLERICRRLEPGSLDCYVQLPADFDVRGASAVDRLREFLVGPLLGRLDALAMTLPFLSPDAIVVLVGAGSEGAETTGDGQTLLHLLARAIRNEPGGPQRAVLLGAECSAERIAEIALDPAGDQRRRLSECAGLGAELSFADWRQEVLSLTGP